jgi:hypothetical protein
MKTRLIPILSLLAVLFVACAPAASTPIPQQLVTLAPTATFPPPVPTLEKSSQPTAGPTQDLAPTPFPIATSRGSNLEATDPSTVSLASGNIQFVEFFQFW